ncbi:MAG: DUF1499 domain-containing protein [Spirochaetota bacterium]
MFKILLTVLLTFLFSACSKEIKIHLRKDVSKLEPCPKSPNCVSSQGNESDKEHHIAPIAYQGEKTMVKAKILQTLKKFPRVKIIKQTDAYVYAEFTTLIMRYTDDVEFYINEGKKVIDVRSASRVGKSDLGKNRSRIEDFRSKFKVLSASK